MICPQCKAPASMGDQHPNGGDLFVAEELESCTEYYDDATLYQCSRNKNHVFYLGRK